MRAYVDREGCISCGQCTEVCPEVFFMADDGLADTKEDIPKNCENQAIEAQEICPVSVIRVED